jgi:hypothetical protein
MNGECEERAPPIRASMIFSCAARAWKPKLQWTGVSGARSARKAKAVSPPR